MKTLKGLDQKPGTIEETTDERILEQIPSFRRLLKILVGNCVPKPNTDESVDLWQIGLKLKQEGDVQVEEAEFNLIRSKAKENPTQFTAHILGQLLNLLKEAEKPEAPK